MLVVIILGFVDNALRLTLIIENLTEKLKNLTELNCQIHGV